VSLQHLVSDRALNSVLNCALPGCRSPGLTQKAFFKSMFELADLWYALPTLLGRCGVCLIGLRFVFRTTSVDPREYVAFLVNLYLRITKRIHMEVCIRSIPCNLAFPCLKASFDAVFRRVPLPTRRRPRANFPLPLPAIATT
jgi:hypothetical protein